MELGKKERVQCNSSPIKLLLLTYRTSVLWHSLEQSTIGIHQCQALFIWQGGEFNFYLQGLTLTLTKWKKKKNDEIEQ